ncbi:YPDG domain-containing protein [Streptococcus hyovaginalis]|uniref:YPDG domain-containing protein n=1 Tax=Streptococcus hyovaginalis TaxID=149015 RepID=UPI003B3B2B10
MREGFVDANGVIRKFDAVAAEYYRIWIEDFTTSSGNTATMLRVAGGLYPGAYADALASSQGKSMGEWLTAGLNLQRTAVWMFERPNGDYMTRPNEEWIESPAASFGAARTLQGKVWYETNSLAAARPADLNDPVAANKTVVFSSLTPDGILAYEQTVASLPILERAAAAKQLLTDHPEYISATVYTTTDADGNYRIQFPEGTYNDRYLYGYVMDTDGTILNTYSPFTSPEFRNPMANSGLAPLSDPLPWGLANPEIQAVYNLHFAIAPSNLVSLDITNYDTTANPASPGDEAKIDLSGATLSPLPNKLVWTDSQGNVVKEVLDVTSHTDGETRGTFTVPADATPGEIYTVTLYTNDVAIAADSFIVASKQAAEYTPTYAPSTFTEGKGGTVEAPTFTDSTGNTVDAPSGTTYEPGNTVPEGFTVNPNGTITVDPLVPVGEHFVPTVVVYPDGSKETVFAQVTIDPITAITDAETFVPVYPSTNVTPGTPATSKPTITDADGNPTTAPEGTKFEIPSDFTPPTGYKVTIDETTGAVTITAPDNPNGDTAETIEVPVIVTYPDGTKDGVEPNAPVKAVFNLDTDGDGTPDTTDTDDDGDGIPDTVDQSAKTNNPTVISSNDATVTEGQPITPIPISVSSDNPKAGVKVSDLPDGLVFDPNTGEITGTPTPLTDWAPDEESREVRVTINAVDENGDPILDGDGNPITDTIVITVQRDTDGEGTPDTEDTDDDNDGVNDSDEDAAGLDPKNPDTDDNGVNDGQEDTDKDGINNDDESKDDGTTITDEDGDGKADLVDPLDTDGDGIPDTEDTDDDNDGVNDSDEDAAGLDPKNPDTDDNGVNDGQEDTDKDGINNDDESKDDGTTITDEDGDGKADLVDPLDTDGDGIPDTEDTDDDNDGVNDSDEDAAELDPKHDDATGNSVKETTQIATNEVVNRRQSDASTKYQAKLPETGEESNMGILAGTAILFAVGALGKRKKKEV